MKENSYNDFNTSNQNLLPPQSTPNQNISFYKDISKLMYYYILLTL